MMVEGRDDTDLETFQAIESLLETLSVLNRLETSIDAMVQRVPGELHTLVETTLEEVERCVAPVRTVLIPSRHRENELAASQAPADAPQPSLRLVTAPFSLDTLATSSDLSILKDLFWALYAKLQAVLEGYRIIYEVSRWIAAVSAGLSVYELRCSDATSKRHHQRCRSSICGGHYTTK